MTHHGPADHRRMHQLRRVRARVPERRDLDGRGSTRSTRKCTQCVGHFDERHARAAPGGLHSAAPGVRREPGAVVGQYTPTQPAEPATPTGGGQRVGSLELLGGEVVQAHRRAHVVHSPAPALAFDLRAGADAFSASMRPAALALCLGLAPAAVRRPARRLLRVPLGHIAKAFCWLAERGSSIVTGSRRASANVHVPRGRSGRQSVEVRRDRPMRPMASAARAVRQPLTCKRLIVQPPLAVRGAGFRPPRVPGSAVPAWTCNAIIARSISPRSRSSSEASERAMLCSINALLGGRLAQHIIHHLGLHAGVADAQAQPPVIGLTEPPGR